MGTLSTFKTILLRTTDIISSRHFIGANRKRGSPDTILISCPNFKCQLLTTPSAYIVRWLANKRSTLLGISYAIAYLGNVAANLLTGQHWVRSFTQLFTYPNDFSPYLFPYLKLFLLCFSTILFRVRLFPHFLLPGPISSFLNIQPVYVIFCLSRWFSKVFFV